MSHWNYAMTVRTVDGDQLWEVREVFWNDDGTLQAWSQDGVSPSGESVQELEDELAHMARVSEGPVLDLDTGSWVDRERRPLKLSAPITVGELVQKLEQLKMGLPVARADA